MSLNRILFFSPTNLFPNHESRGIREFLSFRVIRYERYDGKIKVLRASLAYVKSRRIIYFLSI